MLVTLYSSKTPIAVFSLPILIGILCAPIFFTTPQSAQYLINWQIVMVDWVQSQAIINYCLTVVILSTIAHQINNVYNAQIFYSKATFLPGLIYVLMLLSLGQLTFSTAIIAQLFVVLSLSSLMKTRRQDNAKVQIFWASVFIGIAIGFSSFHLPLLLLPWLTLMAIRPFVWREWFVMLLGAALPMIYYVSIIYLVKGDLDLQLEENVGVEYARMNLLRATNYAIVGLIVVGSGFKYLGIMRSEVNRFKKLSLILFHLLWLSTASWAIARYLFDLKFFTFVVPLAFFVGTAILHSKRTSVMNLIVIIWLIISAANVVLST
ncbi:MAG: hypothetical protein R2780_05175 [Crocinitomicaceae bacterium]|nr:hypothetical protein [Crocinitomicaceae bacterium]